MAGIAASAPSTSVANSTAPVPDSDVHYPGLCLCSETNVTDLNDPVDCRARVTNNSNRTAVDTPPCAASAQLARRNSGNSSRTCSAHSAPNRSVHAPHTVSECSSGLPCEFQLSALDLVPNIAVETHLLCVVHERACTSRFEHAQPSDHKLGPGTALNLLKFLPKLPHRFSISRATHSFGLTPMLTTQWATWFEALSTSAYVKVRPANHVVA